MKYIEYKIYTNTDELDSLSGRLAAEGLSGLVINDPRDAAYFDEGAAGWVVWDYVDRSVLDQFEEGAWIAFYMQEGEALPDGIAELLKGYDVRRTLADDEDWLHKWEEYYVPMRLSPHIVAKPVWKEYEARPDDIVVDIDPGLAFGTGSSPTSYLAVRLMEKYFPRAEKDGPSVADIGCGTGILSVIAAKLGAKHITAADIDPEAVRSTAVNAELNGCGEKMTVFKSSFAEDIHEKVDVVLANLTAELVMELCGDVARICRPGTLFIASGIIDDREEVCCERIRGAGFEIVGIERDDCWSAVAARYTGV